jgi:hypothetical protein
MATCKEIQIAQDYLVRYPARFTRLQALIPVPTEQMTQQHLHAPVSNSLVVSALLSRTLLFERASLDDIWRFVKEL